MATITFDMLKFTKKLEKAGLPQEQAEASAEAEVATKLDVEHLEIKIAEMKFDLLKWIVGMSLAQFSVLIGILLKIAT